MRFVNNGVFKNNPLNMGCWGEAPNETLSVTKCFEYTQRSFKMRFVNNGVFKNNPLNMGCWGEVPNETLRVSKCFWYIHDIKP